jgi:cytochrome P450
MWRLADRHIDEFIADGHCEFLAAYARPFSLLVVADLLGVPEEDHEEFREAFGAQRPGSSIGGLDHEPIAANPLEWADEKFSHYIEDRRVDPRDDVLTGLATATFPDGSTPEVADVVRVAANVFSAGQETTVRLLSSAARLLAERPDLQQLLRGDPSRIPNFVEETLRVESPIKGDFRMAKVPTTVGGVAVPAGTILMLVNGAANRDPRRFDDPGRFDPDRPNARHHLAFGRGIHTCPGAPLARAEARAGLERLLARTADIRISERVHGPADARRFQYLPTFILRGLVQLTLEVTPAGAR